MSTSEGQALASSLGVGFAECSVKTNLRVDEVFLSLGTQIKEREEAAKARD